MKILMVGAAGIVGAVAFAFSSTAGGITRPVNKPPALVYAELARFADGFQGMRNDNICADRICSRTVSRTVEIAKDGSKVSMRIMQGSVEILAINATVEPGATPDTAQIRLQIPKDPTGLALAKGAPAERILDKAIGYIERGEHIPTGEAAMTTTETTRVSSEAPL